MSATITIPVEVVSTATQNVAVQPRSFFIEWASASTPGHFETVLGAKDGGGEWRTDVNIPGFARTDDPGNADPAKQTPASKFAALLQSAKVDGTDPVAVALGVADGTPLLTALFALVNSGALG